MQVERAMSSREQNNPRICADSEMMSAITGEKMVRKGRYHWESEESGSTVFYPFQGSGLTGITYTDYRPFGAPGKGRDITDEVNQWKAKRRQVQYRILYRYEASYHKAPLGYGSGRWKDPLAAREQADKHMKRERYVIGYDVVVVFQDGAQ